MELRDMPGTPSDMPAKGGGHVRRGRHARGGKTGTKVEEYNAVGSPEVEEADKEEDGFARGGRKKKRAAGGIALKHGGHAEGREPMHRPDHARRGHRATGGIALKRGGKAEHEREEEREEHEREEREHHARGGHAHYREHEEHERRRRGGHARHEEHEREHHAAGGRAMEGGRTPFSSGHKGMGRSDDASPAARGFEGVRVGDAPD